MSILNSPERPQPLQNGHTNGVSSSESNSDSESDDEKRIPVNKTLIDKYQDENPQLNKIQVDNANGVDDINSDDEIFILQVPKSFDVSLLKKMNIVLKGKTKIKTDDSSYVIKPFEYNSTNILVTGNTVKQLSISGALKMAIDPKGTPDTVSKQDMVDLSIPNLEKRHPLLGSQFNNHVTEVETNAQRIHSQKEQLPTRKRKHKEKEKHKHNKKKKIKEEVIDDSMEQEVIFKMLESHNFSQSKLVEAKTNSV